MKNKILAICLVLALCVTLLAFVSCKKGDAEAAKVMTVSLNPEVEFVLDSNNKVVSVSALNEEGNLVISAQAFDKIEGKSAEEAAELFVQVTSETGYLVSGKVSAGDNEIEISFSGDTSEAQALYNKVKSNVEKYLSKENITATLEKADAIVRDDLEEEVAEVRPDLTEEQIEAMTEKQLLAEILAARKQTADMYSQELKRAYFEAKAAAMEQAKLEVVKSKLNTLQQTAFNAANTVYQNSVETLEQLRFDNLVSETSAYQKALADVRTKKIEYLNLRNEIAQMEQTEVTQEVSERLLAVEKALELAEDTLENVGESANAAIDSAKAAMKTAYDAVMKVITVDVNTMAEEISAKQTEAYDKFFTAFETKYAAAEQAAEKSWNDMETALRES